MASRKSPSAPEWQVILEKIESQNRLTIEAVETNRVVLEDRIQAVATDLGGRLTNVEKAVVALVDRANGTDQRLDGIDGRLDGSTGGWIGSRRGSRPASRSSTVGWTSSPPLWSGSRGSLEPGTRRWRKG